MIALPPELMHVIGQNIWHLFVVFLRVSALVSLLPAFGETSIPARVKLGCAVAFTLIVAAAVPQPTTYEPGFSSLAWMTGSEVMVGLAMGMGLRLFVLALQTAGPSPPRLHRCHKSWGGPRSNLFRQWGIF